MGRFEGKSIIVTGSSSGIGQAALIAYAKEGANVTLHGTSTERIDKTRQLLKEAGIDDARILVIQGDISEEATVQKLINETIQKFKRIDVLVNNAGISNAANIEPNTVENFDKVMAVNLRAPFRLIELALPHLKETKGNVINVSSIAAFSTPMNSPIMTVYCMSKAALDRMTQVEALRLAPFGIRVNSINPGPVMTNISARNNPSFVENAKSSNDEAVRNITSKITPLGRSAKPEELNEMFLLLADNDKGSFITGAIWAIDGGMSVYAPTLSDLKID